MLFSLIWNTFYKLNIQNILLWSIQFDISFKNYALPRGFPGHKLVNSKDLEYSILVFVINVLWYLSGKNTRQKERDKVAENTERAIMMYSQTCS